MSARAGDDVKRDDAPAGTLVDVGCSAGIVFGDRTMFCGLASRHG